MLVAFRGLKIFYDAQSDSDLIAVVLVVAGLAFSAYHCGRCTATHNRVWGWLNAAAMVTSIVSIILWGATTYINGLNDGFKQGVDAAQGKNRSLSPSNQRRERDM